jgi:hypothetical protein
MLSPSLFYDTRTGSLAWPPSYIRREGFSRRYHTEYIPESLSQLASLSKRIISQLAIPDCHEWLLRKTPSPKKHPKLSFEYSDGIEDIVSSLHDKSDHNGLPEKPYQKNELKLVL